MTAADVIQGIVETRRKEAVVLAWVEWAESLRYLARSHAMLDGPKARRGARSHDEWRRCWAAVLRWKASQKQKACVLYLAAAGVELTPELQAFADLASEEARSLVGRP